MERQTRRVLMAATAVYAVFLTAAWLLPAPAPLPPIPPVPAIHLIDIQPYADAWVARAYQLADQADQFPGDERSPLILYENDKQLGPAHSTIPAIEHIGHGRYSHWQNVGIMFSASANSNPKENGRGYWAVMPDQKP